MMNWFLKTEPNVPLCSSPLNYPCSFQNYIRMYHDPGGMFFGQEKKLW